MNKLTEQIKRSGRELDSRWIGGEKPAIFDKLKLIITFSQIELLKVLKEEVEKAKVSHAPDCPYMYWRCECDFAVKEGGGYNNALSQVIELLDNTIKENI